MNTKALTIHPAAQIIPTMPDDQYQKLVASIHEHGLQVPIVLLDDQILDGRHRYRAIQDLQDQGVAIEPRFEDWQGTGDPLTWVLTLNLDRRHLNAAQRACIAYEYAKIMTARQGGAREGAGRPSKNEGEQPQGTADKSSGPRGPLENTDTASEPAGRTRDIAGNLFAVSGRTVERVKRIAEQAPDLYLGLKDSSIPDVGLAEKELRNRLWEADKADKAARAVPAVSAPSVPGPSGAVPAGGGITVRAGEWWHMEQHKLYIGHPDEAAFVSAMPRETLAIVDAPLWGGAQAQGVCDTLDGLTSVQAWLPSVGELSAAFMDARSLETMPHTRGLLAWTLACHIVGDQTLAPVGFGRWQPILVVQREGLSLDKREMDFRIVKWRERDGDLPFAEGQMPRALMKWLLELFTDAGNPVIVPWARSASALLACRDMGRVFYGAEADTDAAAAILTRWQQETGQTVRRV